MRKLIVFLLLLSLSVSATATDLTKDYLLKTIEEPTVCFIGGEWAVIGLARGGYDCEDFFNEYYHNVCEYVKLKEGVIHSRKNTEYSRVVLALTAINKDPRNVMGYNLILPLLDYDKTVKQGINGAIWALIALDSGNYGNAEIRNKYIEKILASEKNGGGWALGESSTEPDADITAMALIALSHYRYEKRVYDAVERGIMVLSNLQNEDGGYISYNTETAETSAQVLTAMATLGISSDSPLFTKNKVTLKDNIMSFKTEDGSFLRNGKSDIMTTEQSFYSLMAEKRFLNGFTSLFKMSDVGINVRNYKGFQLTENILLKGASML